MSPWVLHYLYSPLVLHKLRNWNNSFRVSVQLLVFHSFHSIMFFGFFPLFRNFPAFSGLFRPFPVFFRLILCRYATSFNFHKGFFSICLLNLLSFIYYPLEKAKIDWKRKRERECKKNHLASFIGTEREKVFDSMA